MNCYVVLGIPQNADSVTVRTAFRALARRYHPDAGEGSSAGRFRQIVAAYETLNDPVRRADYDRSLGLQQRVSVRVVEPLIPEAPRRSRHVPVSYFDDRREIDALFDSLFAAFFSFHRPAR